MNDIKTDMTGTKWELFKTTIGMFAQRGYANVSIRDIATAANLNPASIYNHFPSKEAFTKEAYRFYRENYYACLPDLEDLLALVPKMSSQELLLKMMPIYMGEMLDLMTKIVLIAMEERRRDADAHKLITEVFVKMPKRYLNTLVGNMMERNMIEPVDINNLVNIYSAFNMFASVRVGGYQSMTIEEWREGYNFIFGIIREKNN